MKKLLGLIFIVSFLFMGCQQEEDLTKVSLMLDYTPNTNHTGLYVAQEKGFYADEGIDLEILGAPANGVEQAVSSQSVDFGITYSENFLLAANAGITNLQSIYTILSENTSGLMSYADKNITSLSDLEGKTYCGWGTDIEEFFIKYLAKQGGVAPKTIVFSDSGQDFIRGEGSSCDFYWEYRGWAAIEANLNNIDYNFISLRDQGLDWYTPIIITSNEFISKHNDLVQSFVNATIRGYIYANESPKEAANVFLKYNDTYDKDFIQASQTYVSKYYVNEDGIAGYQKPKVWKDFAAILKDNEVIEGKVKVTELFTNEFVDNFYHSEQV